MKLYRLQLRALGPWRTPLRSDTLSGLLCWAVASRHGGDFLRSTVLLPALGGQPPFVLSDAMPGDRLPAPLSLQLLPWSEDRRRFAKRIEWLPRSEFRVACTRPSDLDMAHLGAEPAWIETVRAQHQRDRSTESAGSTGGRLFTAHDTWARTGELVSLYLRASDHTLNWLQPALEDMVRAGLGADRSTGAGAFDIVGDLAADAGLDDTPPTGANGVVVLSTWQPSANDPADGLWRTLVKTGRLGSQLGVIQIFKRPVVLMRAGAVLRSKPRPFVGRAIDGSEMLAPSAVTELAAQGVHPTDFAFGLCVPAVVPDFTT